MVYQYFYIMSLLFKESFFFFFFSFLYLDLESYFGVPEVLTHEQIWL